MSTADISRQIEIPNAPPGVEVWYGPCSDHIPGGCPGDNTWHTGGPQAIWFRVNGAWMTSIHPYFRTAHKIKQELPLCDTAAEVVILFNLRPAYYGAGVAA
jgi:hypothetical protein